MIGAHGLLRVSGGTSAVLIGLYLAMLSNAGAPIGSAVVGTLGALSFVAELVAAIPLGLASDATQPRLLMTAGALAGATAALLFAVSSSTVAFSASRVLEGLGAAAIVPALLSYLADATETRPALRARAMSYFELTLLAGLALGGVAAAQLFRVLHGGAFVIVALGYLACAVVFATRRSGAHVRHLAHPLRELRTVFRLPALRRLAPVWLCVNAVVGLWLGPVLPYVLTRHEVAGQVLPGLFAADPARVGWVLLVYATVFGTGVTAWSFVLPRVSLDLAMRITLGAMLPASACLFVLNHIAADASAIRWLIGGVTAVFVMIESGFTPAALAWLAGSLPLHAGRGAAMGVYSVLLSVGAIVGSLLAGWLGGAYAFDGLLLGTVLMVVAALLFLRAVSSVRERPRGAT